MKHLFAFTLSFFFCFSITLSHAQANESDLRNTLDEYLEILNSGDLVKTLDYMPDEFFEMVPKKLMEQQILQMFQDSSFQIEFGTYHIDSISELAFEQGTAYAKINYHGSFKMKMAETIDEMTAEFMQIAMGESLGPKNVKFDASINTFLVDTQSALIGIKKEESTWRFVENKPEFHVIFKNFISDEIKEQLKL